MAAFEFRGLEFHSSRMWRWASVERAVELMAKTGLNALVFHQNDLIDHLVLPKAYFTDELNWKRWPIRRSTILANRIYIRQVVELAKRHHIGFYLEVKELWYPEALLELMPELRSPEGPICPTNPFWFEFLEQKIRELLQEIPDIAGIIVSPATRESKISISTNPCPCERCRGTDPKAWYKRFIDAAFGPLSERGKTLVVRDFAYTVDQQDSVIDAAAECSGDIVVGLKNVPHDFWPTFPDNPRIGRTNGLRQWIEFDVWGQYCGLGIYPCSLVEDMQRRMQYCRDRGATGVWFRTDWEICNEASTFNSFNLLNVFGGAMLAENPDIDADHIYRAWAEYGLFSPLRAESSTGEPAVPRAEDAWKKLQSFMRASWSVIEKTLYVRGHVFQLSSKVQQSMEDIFHVMTKHHDRTKWDPGAFDVRVLTDENLQTIFAEKALAVSEASQLRAILQPETLGLPPAFVRDIEELLDLYRYYVRAFELAARASFLTKRATESKSEKDAEAASEAVGRLAAFRGELAQRLAGTMYPWYIYWTLDVKLLGLLEHDLADRIGEARGEAQ